MTGNELGRLLGDLLGRGSSSGSGKMLGALFDGAGSEAGNALEGLLGLLKDGGLESKAASWVGTRERERQWCTDRPGSAAWPARLGSLVCALSAAGTGPTPWCAPTCTSVRTQSSAWAPSICPRDRSPDRLCSTCPPTPLSTSPSPADQAPTTVPEATSTRRHHGKAPHLPHPSTKSAVGSSSVTTATDVGHSRSGCRYRGMRRGRTPLSVGVTGRSSPSCPNSARSIVVWRCVPSPPGIANRW